MAIEKKMELMKVKKLKKEEEKPIILNLTKIDANKYTI
jgi:hypothetical protein